MEIRKKNNKKGLSKEHEERRGACDFFTHAHTSHHFPKKRTPHGRLLCAINLPHAVGSLLLLGQPLTEPRMGCVTWLGLVNHEEKKKNNNSGIQSTHPSTQTLHTHTHYTTRHYTCTLSPSSLLPSLFSLVALKRAWVCGESERTRGKTKQKTKKKEKRMEFKKKNAFCFWRRQKLSIRAMCEKQCVLFANRRKNCTQQHNCLHGGEVGT